MDFQCFVSSLKLEKNLSPTTIRAYANDLDIFSRFAEGVGKSTVANIDRAAIVEFIEYMKQSTAGRLDQLGLSDATIARRLTAISGFLDYTRATTLPELRNPIKEMKRIKRKSKYKRKLVKAVDEDVFWTGCFQESRCSGTEYYSPCILQLASGFLNFSSLIAEALRLSCASMIRAGNTSRGAAR